MKTLSSLVCCVALSAISSIAADVGVSPGQDWKGFMNVFNLPSAGGAYQFGQSWGTNDLCSNWSGNTLTLSPNTINDPNVYWYTPSGGPGSVGNKIMDANLYVETTGVFTGQTVTFSGTVLANTLFGKQDANGNGWTSVAFIKDFAADYSSSVSVTIPLNVGGFSISLNAINDPARHVQYGFETVGPDVWATDVGQYGSIQLVPEPSVLSLSLLAGAGAFAWLRRRS
jgi:hypothetical protein